MISTLSSDPKTWRVTVYDGNDQLRRVTKKNNGNVVGSEEYWYDNDGMRVAVVKRDANGSRTETILFVGDLEAHYDNLNRLTLDYAHLSLGTPLARIKRTVASGGVMDIEYQFHGLANHTLVALSSTGAINAAFSYTPFGEVLETVDAGGAVGTSNHQRRFNDKQQDDVSQLAYYGARLYDPISFCWTQSDPVFRFEPELDAKSPRKANLYVFSQQNPLRYVDPDGLQPRPCTPGMYCGTPMDAAKTIGAVVVQEAREGWAEHGDTIKAASDLVPGSRVTRTIITGIVTAIDWALSDDSESADASGLPPTPNVVVGPGVGLGKNVKINGQDSSTRVGNLGEKPKLSAKEIRDKNSQQTAQRKHDQALGQVPKKDVNNRNRSVNRSQNRNADANDLTDKKASIEKSHPENQTGKTDQRMRQALEAEKKKPE